MTEELYKGIFKLKEEMAELAVILNKLCVFPTGQYPDGRDLQREMQEELADVKAALAYFIEENGLPEDHIRYLKKLNRFRHWGMTGITPRKDEKSYSYDTVPKEKWIK